MTEQRSDFRWHWKRFGRAACGQGTRSRSWRVPMVSITRDKAKVDCEKCKRLIESYLGPVERPTRYL